MRIKKSFDKVYMPEECKDVALGNILNTANSLRHGKNRTARNNIWRSIAAIASVAAAVLVLFFTVVVPQIAPPSNLQNTPSATAENQIDEKIIDEKANIKNMQKVFHISEGKMLIGFIKKDLADLEKSSVAIVKATVLKRKLNIDASTDSAFNQLTEIHIDEVLKNDGNLIKEDVKDLMEYYNTVIYPEKPQVMHIFSSDGSIPLQIGHQYLLFLKKSPKGFGDYAITGGFQGKYPINEKTLGKDFSELNEIDLEFILDEKDFEIDSENYIINENLWDLSKQVFEKYFK